MKTLKLLVPTVILLFACTCNAEAQEKVTKKGDVYSTVDVMPEYPGGEAGLIAFISENVKYPEKAKKEKISGKVFVSFVIDKKGKVTRTKIARGVNPLLNKEALRVINAMEKWTPGQEKGKPVKVQFTLPINFALS